jgi:hypothetical protein
MRYRACEHPAQLTMMHSGADHIVWQQHHEQTRLLAGNSSIFAGTGCTVEYGRIVSRLALG